MGNGGRWTVRGGLYLPIRLFRISMSPRSAIVIDPDKPRGSKRHLINAVVNIRSMPCLLFNALYRPHCLNRDFTWLEKSSLEKQTSQLSLEAW